MELDSRPLTLSSAPIANSQTGRYPLNGIVDAKIYNGLPLVNQLKDSNFDIGKLHFFINGTNPESRKSNVSMVSNLINYFQFNITDPETQTADNDPLPMNISLAIVSPDTKSIHFSDGYVFVSQARSMTTRLRMGKSIFQLFDPLDKSHTLLNVNINQWNLGELYNIWTKLPIQAKSSIFYWGLDH